MIEFVKRVIFAIREYLILIALLLISLSLISQSENPNLQKVKSFGFINVAIINSALQNINFLISDSQELEQLRMRNAELMLRVNMLREYAIENNEIKGMLKFTEEPRSDLLPSRIISKNFGSIIGNIIIDKGNNDSVKTGMPVINHLGLIGIIYKTSDSFSLVRTLRNAKLSIAVEAQRSGVQGILSWEAGKLILKNIPATYDIEVGDRITSSDFSTLFPPSIPIGIVISKDNNVSGLLSDITIQPYVNFNEMHHLFVMKVIVTKRLKDFELNMLNSKRENE